MTRLAPLLLLLAACSSSGPDDPETLEDGSSGDVDPGGTGDDGLDEGGSSGGESGESGEPGGEWPPACLEATPTEEASCAALELVVNDLGDCTSSDLEIRSVEAVWRRKTSEPEAPVSAVAACGEPLRVIADNAGIYDLRIAVTYAFEDVTWVCVSDEGGGGSEGPSEIGDSYIWERSLSSLNLYPSPPEIDPPPAPMIQGAGCCLLSGQPTDAYVQTPCEEA